MTGSAADLPAPILVVAGPGVPGQTLAAALGRNPQAWGMPETTLELVAVTDGYLREMAGLRQVQMHGLLRGLSQLIAGEQTMDSVDMARRWLSRRAHLPTERVAREIAGLIPPRRMVRPVTAALFDPAAPERLAATFPQARLVRLHRHPQSHGRAVMDRLGGAAAVILGARAPEDDSIVDPQELWLMAETGADLLCAAFPETATITLRTEDLMADPATVLADLAARLGLPADAAAVAAMQRPEASPFAGPGPFGAHLDGEIAAFAAVGPDDSPRAEESLEAAPTWRADGAGLRPEITARARAIGYR